MRRFRLGAILAGLVLAGGTGEHGRMQVLPVLLHAQQPSDGWDFEEGEDTAAPNAAFAVWSMTPAEERFAVLMRLVWLIERDLDALALAESTDNGKPVSLALSLNIPKAA